MTGQKIVVLGTGGTIAGRASNAGDNLGYTAAQVGVAQLLHDVAPLRDVKIESEQVSQIDSKDMDADVWRALAVRCAHWLAQPDVQGIVVTHGTDTLEETAYFLHAVLDPAKPVVITCAMRPSTALVPDGPQNLLDAVAVARTSGARGVVAVCAGTVHAARDVAKVHPYRLDAFGSGDAGPLGYVEEGVVRQLKPWPAEASLVAIGQVVAARHWPRVEIVMSHAGAGSGLVDVLVAQKVDGIVVAGTGNGTLHHVLEASLLKAQAAGVRVVRSSRCPEGRVLATPHDALPDSTGLSPVKARIALMLGLLG
ncbi:MAG: asparaginase [Burkholderiales bacterium]|nr:MAG: asparaginase [Burkholderiales bacterium]